MNGVMDSVQTVLLCALSQIELALRCAVLAVNAPCQILLGACLHVRLQRLAEQLLARLEELVGEIWDEHDEVVEDIRQQSDGSWLIAGGASVDDVAEELDIRDKEEIDAVAIGGLVQEKLSRLPKVGDHFVWGSFDGTVTRATNRRVQEVRLVSRPPEPETKKPDRRDRDKDWDRDK